MTIYNYAVVRNFGNTFRQQSLIWLW